MSPAMWELTARTAARARWIVLKGLDSRVPGLWSLPREGST
ncbi:hypothetical protein [Streptomyces sp. NPDC058457]